MPKWSRRRARLARRRPDGTFKAWPGGRSKAELPADYKRQSFQGIGVHIGAGFKAEHGRAARTGDIFRWKRKDGRYHKLAFWYIKTPHGWRRSPTGTTRPTPKQIRQVCTSSRPGRKHRPSRRRR